MHSAPVPNIAPNVPNPSARRARREGRSAFGGRDDSPSLRDARMVIAKPERIVAAKTDDRSIMDLVLVGVQCTPDELALSEVAEGFSSSLAAILLAR